MPIRRTGIAAKSAIFLLVAASLYLPGCCRVRTEVQPPPYLQLISEPDQRLRNHDAYFKTEEARIDRRKEAYLKEPGVEQGLGKTRIGLALSGGGIRSAAFQLGLMSGLSKRKLLRGVDYLSSVSGGSWAAGAYKSAQLEDDEFFRLLDDTIANEHSKLCDDALRRFDPSAITEPYRVCNGPGATILLSSYRESLKGLKRSLHLLDPLDKDIGYAFRETWRAMIQENFLQGVKNDLPLYLVEDDLADLSLCAEDDRSEECAKLQPLRRFLPGAKLRAGRPYLIINGTHSEGSVSDPARNFPFQFTADAIGTIADCGSTVSGAVGTQRIGYCAKPFFRSLDVGYQGAFLLNERENPVSTLFLSHAMAISGAVAPASFLGIDLGVMEWHLQFPFPDKKITDVKEVPYRKEYVLADGGHSENFGVLPLLERNVGIVIVSDAAFDSEERFSDFAVLKQHAKELQKQEIVLKKQGPGCDHLHDLQWITSGELEEVPLLKRIATGFRPEKDEFRDQLYDPDSRLRFNGQFFGVDHYEADDPNLNVQIGSLRYPDICGAPNANKECREKRGREFEDHRNRYHGAGFTEKPSANPLTYGHFTRYGYAPAAPGSRGTVIYVKPPRDLSEFMNYLLAQGQYHIYNYLLFNKGHFPLDKTFAVSYHNELIQSYYLLGKFISEKYLADGLVGALAQWPEAAPAVKERKPQLEPLPGG